MNFSVLMSIYSKEKPEYLIQCLDSLLNQTLLPTEIVIVKDGPLPDTLNKILFNYETKNPSLFKIVILKENMGLGTALAIGIENCTYETVARMDTDDIARKDRFELQIKEFEFDPDLDILGSSIIEFENNINNILSKRILPLNNTDIYNFAKKRNPFNHMTVMYKKSKVIESGNYQPPNGFEDYYLWARMLKNGCKSKNLPDFLVYARTGLNMFERRGGYDYLKRAISVKKSLYDIGLSSFLDFILSTSSHCIISLLPNKIRTKVYLKFLRK